MARALRIEYPGAFYHIIQSGIEGRIIFLNDRDRNKFLEYIAESHIKYHHIIHSYCLMSTHYHLILETKEANLSRVMHYINSSYSTYFNRKKKRRGSLFGGRYKAILVQADEYLQKLSCYTHLNPVRANIVESPEDYPYSSYNFFIYDKSTPEWLNINMILGIFNRNVVKARKLYKSFVISSSKNNLINIEENIKHGFILGNEEYCAWVRKSFIDEKENKEIPIIEKIKTRPSVNKIREAVFARIDDKKLRKKIMVYLIYKYTNERIGEVAKLFENMTHASASKIHTRMKDTRGKDENLDNLLMEIENSIMSNV